MKIKVLPLECPFCHEIPELIKKPLWNGEGHGYYNCFQYSVQCTNGECKVNPKTSEYNDIYDMTEDDCFNKAIEDWNDR